MLDLEFGLAISVSPIILVSQRRRRSLGPRPITSFKYQLRHHVPTNLPRPVTGDNDTCTPKLIELSATSSLVVCQTVGDALCPAGDW
jgi:hypothetical protein